MALITCPGCGHQVSSAAQFCTACGAVLPAASQAPAEPSVAPAPTANYTAPTPAAPAAKKSPINLAKIASFGSALFCAAGVLGGLIFFIVGLATAISADTTLSYTSFGGDFYTYAYKGLRACEDQLVDVIKAVGGLTTAFGVFMGAFFGAKLCKVLPECLAKKN